MKLEMEFRFLCENIMHPRNTIYFFPDTYCFSVTFSVFSSSLTTTDFVGLSSFCSTLCSFVTSDIVSLIFILLAKMDYNNLITAFFLKLQSIAFINITRKNPSLLEIALFCSKFGSVSWPIFHVLSVKMGFMRNPERLVPYWQKI